MSMESTAEQLSHKPQNQLQLDLFSLQFQYGRNS